MSDAQAEPGAVMERLQTRLIAAIRWVMLAFVPVTAASALAEVQAGRTDPALWIHVGVHTALCGLVFATRSRTTAAIVMITDLQLLMITTLLHYGPNMNTTIAFMGSAMLAELFFGRRASMLVLGTGTALLLLVGLVHSQIGYAPYEASVHDVRDPTVWGRILANASIGVLGITVLFGFIINALHDHIGLLTGALSRERAERSARAAAVAAQRVAEEGMATAQRHEVAARIAASAAHDLNNVLTSILGSAEIAELSADDPEEVRAEAGQIQAAALRASALTRQLLSYTRQESSKRQTVHLGETLDMTRSLVRRLLPTNIDLSVELDPGLPPILADAGQLEQLLLNLCLNARDAMPEGGRLEVRAYRTAPRGGHIALEVKDTGEGMTEDVRAKIFEPYFTTKPRGRGTGLGLPTVRTIVQAHEGRVEVDTEPGAGTTFRVLLPISDGAVSVPAVASEPSEDVAPLRSRAREGVALIADDDPDILRIASKTLESCGFTVLTADNGDAALELAGERAIDLAVIDAIMPGPSGARLVMAIEKLAPRARIICSTAYDAGVFGPGFFADPSRHLLPKPYRRRDLWAAVERAFAALPPRDRPVVDDDPSRMASKT